MNGGTLPELLLVDDVNVSGQVLRQVLTSAGFKVHEAESGRKALDLAASLKPQLIVLDTELPDIGGDEVCRLLKQDPATRHIPVLQVQTEQQGTGAKRPEGEQDARPPRHEPAGKGDSGLEGGADTYLAGPVEPPVLVAMVRVLLRARQAEDALRASEKQLEQQKRLLARSDAELEEVAAIVSHDLRSPLVSIGGCVQLLMEEAQEKLSGESVELVQFTRDSVQQMGTLIKGLLTYARTGSGGVRPTECDVNEIMGAVVRGLKDRIEQTGAEVTHDPLPTVQADEGLLRQLFQHLVENGIKFHGEARPLVHVSVRQEPEEWVFSVRDNGIGIDPAHFQKVFQMFQRVRTDNREYEGIGIGLPVNRKIVERHGGRIWLESEPRRGTTVWFTLPR